MERLTGMERTMFYLNLRDPITRFIGVFVVTNGLIWWIKPSHFFEEVTQKPSPNALVPWWTLGIVTGAVASFFL